MLLEGLQTNSTDLSYVRAAFDLMPCRQFEERFMATQGLVICAEGIGSEERWHAAVLAQLASGLWLLT